MGIERKKPTFLATLKLDEEAKEVQAPKAVQKLLDEFEDVILTKLPKRLPPRREINDAIS